MDSQRFLTERQVTERTTLHRTQIARMVRVGTFPRPIYISERRKAWPEAEVSSWMEAAAAGRDGKVSDRSLSPPETCPKTPIAAARRSRIRPS